MVNPRAYEERSISMDFSTGSTKPDPGEAAVQTGGVQGAIGVETGGEFNVSDPVGSFTETVRRVVLEPTGFFSGMSRRGDYLNPLIFALVCYEIAAVLGGIVGLATDSTGFGGFVGALILAPITAAVGLFIGAGIFHLLAMLIVKPNAGFEATFRVLSYASVTTLVSWIPFIGPLLSLYSLYLGIVGVRETHSTTTGKAALVILIPVAALTLLALLVAALIGALLFSVLNG
jgi:hypothetical protein